MNAGQNSDAITNNLFSIFMSLNQLFIFCDVLRVYQLSGCYALRLLFFNLGSPRAVKTILGGLKNKLKSIFIIITSNLNLLFSFKAKRKTLLSQYN